MGAANTSVLALCHGGKGQGHHLSPHLPQLSHLRSQRCSSLTSVYGEGQGDSGQGQGQGRVGSSPTSRDKRHSNKKSKHSKQRHSKQLQPAAPPGIHSGDNLVTENSKTLPCDVSSVVTQALERQSVVEDELLVDTQQQCQLSVADNKQLSSLQHQQQCLAVNDISHTDDLSNKPTQEVDNSLAETVTQGQLNRRKNRSKNKKKSGVEQQQSISVDCQKDVLIVNDSSRPAQKLTMSKKSSSKQKNNSRDKRQADVATVSGSDLYTGTAAFIARELEQKRNKSVNGFNESHLSGVLVPDAHLASVKTPESHLAGRALLFAPDGFQYLSPVQSPGDPPSPDKLIGGYYDLDPDLSRNGDPNESVKKKRKKVKTKSDNSKSSVKNNEGKNKRPVRKRSLKKSVPATPTATNELYIDTSPTGSRPRSMNDSLSPRHSDFRKRYFDTVVEIVKKHVTVEEIFSDSELHNFSDDDFTSSKRRPQNPNSDLLTITEVKMFDDAANMNTTNGKDNDVDASDTKSDGQAAAAAKHGSPRKKSKKKLSPVVKKVLGWKQANVKKTEVREDIIPQTSAYSDSDIGQGQGNLYPDDSDCLPAGESEQAMPVTGDEQQERLGLQQPASDNDNSITESLYQSVSSSSNPHSDSIGDDASSLHGFETIGSETSSIGDHVHDADSAIGQDAGRSPSPDGVFNEERGPLSHASPTDTCDTDWVTHDISKAPIVCDNTVAPNNDPQTDLDLDLNAQNVNKSSPSQLDKQNSDASETVLSPRTKSRNIVPGLSESKSRLLAEALQSVPVIQQSPLLYAYQPAAHCDDVTDSYRHKALSLASSNTLQPMAMAYNTAAVGDKVALGDQDTCMTSAVSDKELSPVAQEADNHHDNKQSPLSSVDEADLTPARDATSVDDDTSKTLDDKFDTVSTCSECVSYLSADEPIDVFDDTGKSVLPTVAEHANDLVSETCDLELARPCPSPSSPVSAIQKSLEVNLNNTPDEHLTDNTAERNNNNSTDQQPQNSESCNDRNDLSASDSVHNVTDDATADQENDLSSKLTSPIECVLNDVTRDDSEGVSKLGAHALDVNDSAADSRDTRPSDAPVIDLEICQLEVAQPAVVMVIAEQEREELENENDSPQTTDFAPLEDNCQSSADQGEGQDVNQVVNTGEQDVTSADNGCRTVEEELCQLELTRPCDSNVGDARELVAEQTLDESSDNCASNTDNTDGDINTQPDDSCQGIADISEMEAMDEVSHNNHGGENYWTVESEVCQLEVVKPSPLQNVAENNGAVLNDVMQREAEEQLNTSGDGDNENKLSDVTADEEVENQVSLNALPTDAVSNDKQFSVNSRPSDISELSQPEVARPEIDTEVAEQMLQESADQSQLSQEPVDQSANCVENLADDAVANQLSADVEIVVQLEVARPDLKSDEKQFVEEPSSDAANEDVNNENLKLSDKAGNSIAELRDDDKPVDIAIDSVPAADSEDQSTLNLGEEQKLSEANDVEDTEKEQVFNNEQVHGLNDAAALSPVQDANEALDVGANHVDRDKEDESQLPVNHVTGDGASRDNDSHDNNESSNRTICDKSEVDETASLLKHDENCTDASTDTVRCNDNEETQVDSGLKNIGATEEADDDKDGGVNGIDNVDNNTTREDPSNVDETAALLKHHPEHVSIKADTTSDRANTGAGTTNDRVNTKADTDTSSDHVNTGADTASDRVNTGADTANDRVNTKADTTSDRVNTGADTTSNRVNTGADTTSDHVNTKAHLSNAGTKSSEAANDVNNDNDKSRELNKTPYGSKQPQLVDNKDAELAGKVSAINETNKPASAVNNMSTNNKAVSDDKLHEDSSEMNETSSWLKPLKPTANTDKEKKSTSSDKRDKEKPKTADSDKDKLRKDAAEITQTSTWREVPYKPAADENVDSGRSKVRESRKVKDVDKLSYVAEASWSFDIEVRTYTFSTLSADEYRRNRDREQRELATQRMQLERRSRTRFGYRGLLSEFKPSLLTDCFESVVASK